MRRIGTLLLFALALSGDVAGAAGRTTDWQGLIVTDGPAAESERRALVESLRLLPRLPIRVAVIDATEAKPDVQPTLLSLDAFVVIGSPVVYVVRQSALLRGARDGSTAHTHALAAAIWHEMAHVDGADERQARTREQALWTTFVRDERVDNVVALRYLNLLNGRPDDFVMAFR